ncbi:WbqC family protein [Salinibacter ruber]|nr:WbqC family protein [Salinibacter ruber]MCS4116157.1 hypothetical protein [Salinibacter ruber]MCS4181668.1 hypothetical protein [Salinibacter ruber]
MDEKTVAVMQPYLFPYLGYFQLIQEADVFVFYDDVDFITRGWINRNRILINDEENIFTIPCSNASQNEKIKDVLIGGHWRPDKLLKKVRLTYSNADQFDAAFPTVKTIIEEAGDQISVFAEDSVRQVAEYLNLDVNFYRSSDLPVDQSFGRAERLIELTKHFGASTYVNMEGGKDLYDKSTFADQGITLHFLSPNLPEYEQYTAEDGTFHSGLSIIDVMMNVEPPKIREMLDTYQLQ